jgi:hypothetical protein
VTPVHAIGLQPNLQFAWRRLSEHAMVLAFQLLSAAAFVMVDFQFSSTASCPQSSQPKIIRRFVMNPSCEILQCEKFIQHCNANHNMML